MKAGDLGLKVTAIEALAYLVPGAVSLWLLVEADRRGPGLLGDPWPDTSLETAAAAALTVVLGVVLQEIGHIFKLPYDKVYAPLARRAGDRVLARALDLMQKAEDYNGRPYAYAATALRAAGHDMAQIEMAEGISKMFRAVATAALAAALWCAATRNWVPALTALAALVAAFWIHGRFRLAASTALYQSYNHLRARDGSAPVDAPA